MKDKYPKAWADFEGWYESQDKINYIIPYISSKPNKNKYVGFTDLSFEMQLGVYLKYLDENGINICTKKKEGIEQAFKIREEKLCESK